MNVNFDGYWRHAGGVCYTFVTPESIDLGDGLDSRDFRLDLNNDGTHEVYNVGDSEFAGFLVSEEVPASEVGGIRSLMRQIKALSAAELFEMDRTHDFAIWQWWYDRDNQIDPPLFPDWVKVILDRPREGKGGGIPLSRGEVLALFADGHAGDAPGLLDVRAFGYGKNDGCDGPDCTKGCTCWHGLTDEDVLEDEVTFYLASDWAPFELWPIDKDKAS